MVSHQDFLDNYYPRIEKLDKDIKKLEQELEKLKKERRDLVAVVFNT